MGVIPGNVRALAGVQCHWCYGMGWPVDHDVKGKRRMDCGLKVDFPSLSALFIVMLKPTISTRTISAGGP